MSMAESPSDKTGVRGIHHCDVWCVKYQLSEMKHFNSHIGNTSGPFYLWFLLSYLCRIYYN